MSALRQCFATILVLSLFAAVAHAAPVVLRVTAAPSIFSEMFRELAVRFQDENPDIRINLDASQVDQPAIALQTLRSAIIDDLPDVSFQGYNYLRTLADRKLLAPLDGFIKNDPAWTAERYSPSVASSGRVGSMVYGLGVGMSFPVIFYNKTLVSKVQGGDVALPDNWDGILDLAQRIQSRDPEVLGVFVRYNSFIFQGLVGCFGGSMMNADETQITFTDAAGRRAFQLLRRIGEAGQAKVDMTRPQSRQAFVGGRTAITIDSSSSLASFESEVAGRFEIGTAQLPLSGRDASLPAAGVAVVMFTKDAGRQAAAWRFMKFVASVEGGNVVGRTTGYVPANEIAVKASGPLAAYYAEHPNSNAGLSSVAVGRGWYAFPGENAARIDSMIEDRLGEVVRLHQLPEPALDQLAKDIRSMLPR